LDDEWCDDIGERGWPSGSKGCPTGSSGSTSSYPTEELETAVAGRSASGDECSTTSGSAQGTANDEEGAHRMSGRLRLKRAVFPPGEVDCPEPRVWYE